MTMMKFVLLTVLLGARAQCSDQDDATCKPQTDSSTLLQLQVQANIHSNEDYKEDHGLQEEEKNIKSARHTKLQKISETHKKNINNIIEHEYVKTSFSPRRRAHFHKSTTCNEKHKTRHVTKHKHMHKMTYENIT